MKSQLIPMLTAAAFCLPAIAEETKTPAPAAVDQARHLSLKLEIERAIDNGVNYLRSVQNEDGSWSNPDFPALSALPLHAVMGNPAIRDRGEPMPDFARKGYGFLLANQKEDGGIYNRGLASYNTSVSIMALLSANDPALHDNIRKARTFLIGQQQFSGAPGETNDPVDGGIGYGNSLPHSDLSNTHLALEALYHSRHLAQDEGPNVPDLDWAAALKFVSRCQNLPATNDQEWATDLESERGGFVYTPLESKAGEIELPGGRVGLRSYGSMSYAGLLSFIYADVKPDDPRVLAAKDWIQRHYTVEENPRMGGQGLFYYYHTMAKALSTVGLSQIETGEGRTVDWKSELAVRVMEFQKEDGSWTNEVSPRWMENDRSLVTAYSLLTLQHIYYNL